MNYVAEAITSQHTTTTWATLVQYFGVPGAMLAVVLFAVIQGYLIPRREALRREADALDRLKQSEERRVADNAECVARRAAENVVWQERFNQLRIEADERYDELKKESVERLLSLRTEKDYWRETALKATHLAVQSVNDRSIPTTGGGS